MFFALTSRGICVHSKSISQIKKFYLKEIIRTPHNKMEEPKGKFVIYQMWSEPYFFNLLFHLLIFIFRDTIPNMMIFIPLVASVLCILHLLIRQDFQPNPLLMPHQDMLLIKKAFFDMIPLFVAFLFLAMLSLLNINIFFFQKPPTPPSIDISLLPDFSHSCSSINKIQIRFCLYSVWAS